MDTMPLEDKLLLVFLALFGAGIAIIDQHVIWGLSLITVGGVGTLCCIWQHLRDPASGKIKLTWALIGQIYRTRLYRDIAIGIVLAWALYSLTDYVLTLRNDLDLYVMPRTVTPKQADDLRDFLSRHKAYSVTLKVDPQDQEALQYWGQLGQAFNRTDWKVEMSTASAPPQTGNSVCLETIGWNARPFIDSKDDPGVLLQQALQAAHIESPCGGSQGDGEYKLYILVGHRPLKVGDEPPFRFRLARWLMQMDSK